MKSSGKRPSGRRFSRWSFFKSDRQSVAQDPRRKGSISGTPTAIPDSNNAQQPLHALGSAASINGATIDHNDDGTTLPRRRYLKAFSSVFNLFEKTNSSKPLSNKNAEQAVSNLVAAHAATEALTKDKSDVTEHEKKRAAQVLSLESEVASLSNNNSDLVAESTKAAEFLVTLNAQITRLSTVKVALRDAAKRQAVRIQSLKAEIVKLSHERSCEVKQAATMAQHIRVLVADVGRLSQDKSELLANLEAVTSECERVNAKFGEVWVACNIQKANLKELVGQVKAHAWDARNANEENAELRGINRELEAKLARSERSEAALREKYAKLKEESGRLKATAVSIHAPTAAPVPAPPTTPVSALAPASTQTLASADTSPASVPLRVPSPAPTPAQAPTTPVPVPTAALPAANAARASDPTRTSSAPAGAYMPPAIRKSREEAARAAADNGVAPGVDNVVALTTGGGRSLADMVGFAVDTRDDKTKELATLEILFGAIRLPSKRDKSANHETLSPGSVRVGVGSEQGIRSAMEDRHVVEPDMHATMGLPVGENDVRVGVYAVYDGHCGARVSDYAAANVHKYAALKPGFFANETRLADGTVAPWSEGFKNATNAAFAQVDDECMSMALAQTPVMPDGSCALTMALQYALGKGIDSRPTTLAVANVGDSRAVLSSDGRAMDLSTDHTPRDRDERERIEGAGGFVTSEHVAATAYVWDIDWSNPGLTKAPEKQLRLSSAMRVNGELAVSRSIGDVDYKKPRVDEYPWSFPQEHAVHKQSSASSSAAPLTFNFKSSLVVCEPEWECRKIAAKDEFVILACDGLWDVMESETACHLVRMYMRMHALKDSQCSADDCASMLVQMALGFESSDNVTALVIIF